MPYTINEIEGLVLEKLNVTPLNVYCKNFERYDGQFDVEDVKALRVSPPAVLVAYVGDRLIENTPLARYTKEMNISVIVVANNLRGNFEAKTDSSGGAYKMLDDIQTILHLNALGKTDINGMVLKRRVPLLNTRTLAVFGLDFTLEFIA